MRPRECWNSDRLSWDHRNFREWKYQEISETAWPDLSDGSDVGPTERDSGPPEGPRMRENVCRLYSPGVQRPGGWAINHLLVCRDMSGSSGTLWLPLAVKGTTNTGLRPTDWFTTTGGWMELDFLIQFQWIAYLLYQIPCLGSSVNLFYDWDVEYNYAFTYFDDNSNFHIHI